MEVLISIDVHLRTLEDCCVRIVVDSTPVFYALSQTINSGRGNMYEHIPTLLQTSSYDTRLYNAFTFNSISGFVLSSPIVG